MKQQISVYLTPELIRSIQEFAREWEFSFSAGLRRLARLGLEAEQSGVRKALNNHSKLDDHERGEAVKASPRTKETEEGIQLLRLL